MTLRTGTPIDVQHMFDSLRASSRALITDIVRLVYFMRGSISYTEAMMMTYGERELVGEFIKERLEIEVKRPHPNY